MTTDNGPKYLRPVIRSSERVQSRSPRPASTCARAPDPRLDKLPRHVRMQFEVGGIDDRSSLIDAAVRSKVLCAEQASQNSCSLSVIADETDLRAGQAAIERAKNASYRKRGATAVDIIKVVQRAEEGREPRIVGKRRHKVVG